MKINVKSYTLETFYSMQKDGSYLPQMIAIMLTIPKCILLSSMKCSATKHQVYNKR